MADYIIPTTPEQREQVKKTLLKGKKVLIEGLGKIYEDKRKRTAWYLENELRTALGKRKEYHKERLK